MNQDIALSKLRPADPRGSIYQEFDEYDSDGDNGSRPKHKVTKKIKKFGFRKKKYKSITDEMREQLIDAIQNEGLKIKHAAKKLRMNYSSAKSIFKIFKREGRLNKKIFKRRSDLQEDDHSVGTPMSEDLDSSQETHSQMGVKEELSSTEDIQDHPSVKIVVQTQEEPFKVTSSPLLKREEVEEISVSSRKSSREDLNQSLKINQDTQKISLNPNQTLFPQNQRNFYSVEDLMKQSPYLFADNSAKLFANNNNMMSQQPVFAGKIPGPFPPSAFLPKIDPLILLGQGAPKPIHFTGFGMQQGVGQANQMMMMANKMNPFLSNPYAANLNPIDPFLNYSLLHSLNNNNSYLPLKMNCNSSKQ